MDIIGKGKDNFMKKGFIYIILGILLVGCGSNNAINPQDDQIKEDNTLGQKTVSDNNIVFSAEEDEVSPEQLWEEELNKNADVIKDREMEVPPMYFKEDYKNYESSLLDIYKYGDKNICLSEIVAYYQDNGSMEAEMFGYKYEDYLEVTGIAKDEVCEQIAKDSGCKMDQVTFDAEEVFVRMKLSSCICLLHINHPSIFGTNAAYLVLTDLYLGDNNLNGVVVRDPNKKNLDKYAIAYTDYNEPVYSFSAIIGAAGDDSTCWIFYYDDRSEDDKYNESRYKTGEIEEGIPNRIEYVKSDEEVIIEEFDDSDDAENISDLSDDNNISGTEDTVIFEEAE